MPFCTKTKALGGIIKEYPEDFIVEEVLENGSVLSINYNLFEKFIDLLPKRRKEHLHFTLVKKNWDTINALRKIAKRLNVSFKRIGYAGNKDKFAVTAQRCSIWNIGIKEIKRIKIKDIKIKEFSYSNKRIDLGMIYGNRFTITIREIQRSREEINQILNEFISESKNGLLNFFGIQRFGDKRSVNHLIGKQILIGNFENALKIFLCETGKESENSINARKYLSENWGDFKGALKIFPIYLKPERTILDHLSRYPNDLIGALRKLPKFLRLIFVNAYQSYIFNLTIEKMWGNGIKEQRKVPMIGFNTKLADDETSKAINEIMEKEGIKIEDFKIKRMPEMSLSGSERDYLLFPEKFKVLKIGNHIAKIRFTLRKGCYATTVLRELMKNEAYA